MVPGFKYVAAISVPSSADGALANYQFDVEIVKGAGTNSGIKAFLNNHAENWPNDIRFVAADGETELKFHRQSSDDNGGWWVVKVPSIPSSGGTVIYLYYGKSGADDVSDPVNTYGFWDDFASLDTDDKWIVELLGWASMVWVSGGVVHARSGMSTFDYGRLRSKYNVVPATGRLEFRARVSADSNSFEIALASADNNTYARFHHYANIRRCATNAVNLSRGSSLASWRHLRIDRVQGGGVWWYIDRALEASTTNSGHVPGGDLGIRLRARDGDSLIIYCDWVAVRALTADEPELSVGSEQVVPTERSSTLTTKSLFKVVNTKTWSAGAVLRAARPKTVGSNSRFRATVPKTWPADAVMRAEATKDVEVGAPLQVLDVPASVPVDSRMRDTVPAGVEINSNLVSGSVTEAIDLDARMKLEVPEEAGVDAVLAKVLTEEAGVDAVLSRELVEEAGVDAVLAKVLTEEAGVDAVLAKVLTEEAGVDGIVLRSRGPVCLLQTVVRGARRSTCRIGVRLAGAPRRDRISPMKREELSPVPIRDRPADPIDWDAIELKGRDRIRGRWY